jgi:hypothetical protein
MPLLGVTINLGCLLLAAQPRWSGSEIDRFVRLRGASSAPSS